MGDSPEREISMLRISADLQPFAFHAEGLREAPTDRARSSLDLARSVRSPSHRQFDRLSLLPGDVTPAGVGKIGVAIDVDAKRSQANFTNIFEAPRVDRNRDCRARAVTGKAASKTTHRK